MKMRKENASKIGRIISKLFVGLLMISLVTGCAVFKSSPVKKEKAKPQKSPAEIRKAMMLTEAKNFIKTKKDDPNIYFGEGVANIGNDLGKAKIEAKDRALADLTKTIESHVQSDISRTLTGISVQTGKMFTDEIEEKIVQKTKIYTNQIVKDVNEKDYTDYPDNGYITYFVYISKSKYKEKVERDLDTKKMMIRTAILNGNKEFENRNFMSALNDWVNADTYLDNFFGDLPLRDDLNNDSSMVEVHAYIDGRISSFFGSSHLSRLSASRPDGDKAKIFYDTFGNVNMQPSVYAQYESATGKKYPITQLPLKAEILEGEGKITEKIITGTYGQTELRINYIDPKNKFSTIKVDIDTDVINGLKKFSLPPLSSLTIKMLKEKSVALSVIFYNNSQPEKSPDLENRIKTLILDNGYSVVNFSIPGQSVDNKDVEKAKQTNADYLLVVNLATGGISQVGGYDNMYSANCSGSISLYNLQTGHVVATQNVPAESGFGVSAQGAGWDAFGKQIDVTLNKARNMIGRIK